MEEQRKSQRKALRERLLAARESIANRADVERALTARVGRWLKTMPVTRLGFYWPIRGEADLRRVILSWLGEDVQRRAGLPVIVERLLEFAPWTADTPMAPGPLGINAPSRYARLSPQLLLIPCIGFDSMRYRLGFGGGFYDRTLAALNPRPVTVGIAFDCARVPSIEPAGHDVRMDLVITESGVL